MNMDIFDEEILSLMIINNKSFANAYDICKVLAWKFDLINCSEIIKRIENKSYVLTSFPTSKTLKHFELTEVGFGMIAERKNDLKVKLIEEFPQEAAFINKL